MPARSDRSPNSQTDAIHSEYEDGRGHAGVYGRVQIAKKTSRLERPTRPRLTGSRGRNQVATRPIPHERQRRSAS